MTEPINDNAPMSVTLKGGPGYEAPWVVFRGPDSDTILGNITEAEEAGLYGAVAGAAASFHQEYDAVKPQRASGGSGNSGRPPLSSEASSEYPTDSEGRLWVDVPARMSKDKREALKEAVKEGSEGKLFLRFDKDGDKNSDRKWFITPKYFPGWATIDIGGGKVLSDLA